MLRRARIALAFVALATLFNTAALFADDPAPQGGDPAAQQGGDPGAQQGGDLGDLGDLLADWLAGLLGGGNGPADDEFNPQHLPGG